MKKLEGYEKAQAYSNTERLPVGGYVLKILDAVEQDNSEKGWNNQLILSFDIVEGEHKDFFAANYKAQTEEDRKWKGTYRLRVPKDDGSEQDNWTMRRFKTVMGAFEDSNSGYHWNWDEQTLKGKLIGALFNNKEYEFNDRHGFYTNCHSLVTVEKIRSGAFEIPPDTLLKNGGQRGNGQSDIGTDFMQIPDGIDEELPFS